MKWMIEWQFYHERSVQLDLGNLLHLVHPILMLLELVEELLELEVVDPRFLLHKVSNIQEHLSSIGVE
jgi:hypothetical protein